MRGEEDYLRWEPSLTSSDLESGFWVSATHGMIVVGLLGVVMPLVTL